MRQYRIPAACAALILFVFSLPVASRAESRPDESGRSTVSIESGFEIATGNYGNQASTTTESIPVSVTWFPTPRLDLGLSIPYLWQSNRLVVAGKPVRTSAAPLAKMTGPGGGMNNPPVPASAKSAISGVGDLLFSAAYTAVAEGDLVPQLRPVVGVKAPTAASGLGTGAADVSMGLSASKWLGGWYLYSDGNYTVQGKTDLFKARNYFGYDAGAGYEVLPGLLPAAGIKGTTPAEEGTGAAVQVEGKVTYILTRALDLKLYVARGLSVASSDWEGGCSLGFNF